MTFKIHSPRPFQLKGNPLPKPTYGTFESPRPMSLEMPIDDTGAYVAVGDFRIPGFGDVSTGMYQDWRLGTAVPTYGPTWSNTRATASTTDDHEGLVKNILPNEFRFRRLRRVENKVSSPEVFTSGWINTTVTVTTGVTDPLGGTTAVTLTATGASSSLLGGASGAPSGSNGANSYWVRRRTGTGTIKLRQPNNAGQDLTATITTSWQRIATTNTNTSGTFYWYGYEIITSGDAIDVWHPQAEDVTGQAITAPSEYVSKGVLSSPWYGAGVDGVRYFTTLNGNTVASNVVTEATGAALPTTGAVRPFGQHTNLALQSENFATTWIVSGVGGSLVSSSDSVGAVALDLMGDTNAADVTGYSQQITYTGNGQKGWSFYAKKGTSTSSVFRLRDTTAAVNRVLGAITWTGAVPTVTMTTGTLEGIDALANGVYRIRVLAPGVVAANANFIGYFPATDAALSVGGTGTILWGGVMPTDLSAADAPYVKTTTAQVTVNADVPTANGAGVINQTEGGLFLQALGSIGQNNVGFAVDDGTNNEVIYLRDSSLDKGGHIVDGGVAQTSFGPNTSFTTGVRGKAAIRYRLNDSNKASGGTLDTIDTLCTMPTTTTFRLGFPALAGFEPNTDIEITAYTRTGPTDAGLQQATT